jgi:ATP-dependent 26S proteasome regulatory subunit
MTLFYYERLAQWGAKVWKERQPTIPYVTLWADTDCANLRAHTRLNSGHVVNAKTTFQKIERLDCPLVTPISFILQNEDSAEPGWAPGAYWVTFDTFSALYAAIYTSEHTNDDTMAIALVPAQHLNDWLAFQKSCETLVRNLPKRQDVYVIGGTNAHFKPTIDWDDVILSEGFKNDLVNDMEAFFTKGVEIYKQLNLAAFRKLLLVGPPGTGKTMLCAALAKLAIERGRIVVYVSGSDFRGATFQKIHQALQIVAQSAEPVVLIVEEFDNYLTKENKAQILNVLDGMETPNNPKGALLIATTNYPEIIDRRIAKRPGRLDRILVVPPIENEELAERMLIRYMGNHWQESHRTILRHLIGQTGAFVREMSLHARMLAAHTYQSAVTLELLEESYQTLKAQLAAADDLIPHGNTPADESGDTDDDEERESPPARVQSNGFLPGRTLPPLRFENRD